MAITTHRTTSLESIADIPEEGIRWEHDQRMKQVLNKYKLKSIY